MTPLTTYYPHMWLCIVGLLFATITINSVVWALVVYYVRTTETAMKLGYTQATLPGSPYVYWTKLEDKQ